MPLSLDPAEGGSLSREFLVRYGHHQDAAVQMGFRLR
jgi:hypothetical protein